MGLTSIIIPTFQGLYLLRECVASIRSHTHSPYEIIVVDNGSDDGTLQYCREENLMVISFPNNRGFPIAVNWGLRIAAGDHLLLLNNDIVVGPNWLDNMLACLASSPDIGIVGPYTNYISGRQQRNPEYETIEGYQEAAAAYNKQDPGKYVTTERLVGFCMLFSRELMERIGLLDERYSPGHYEDDDYCYRARKAGYRLMISGDVIVHHHGSATFLKMDSKERAHLVRESYKKFVDKWGFDPNSLIEEPST
ncbi:glycosyl transferase [Paenibacillus sp. J31TS4]|uniref:glycosyltransferase family 2 protein n=1 Tax=Paenibacillus sp. J31TS4 TaxID=2807195 RepID=UPI001B016027|nr:glycosyltransferase family 2 protein [Paenibacillus sp. J31TS4]GIP39126.1 glycosyl transferase [Paenibacillus sp. J31TS4]